MNYIIIKHSNHQDWLKTREGGIGSSEVGTILGLNPFQTPYQLWRLKTGRDPYVETENVVMKMGHYLEPVVARLYTEETGSTLIKATENEFVVVSKNHPFMKVSPDRLVWIPEAPHTEKNKRIVECKTTQRPVEDGIPHDQWVAQLMYQMGVYDKDYGALAWLVQGRDFGYRNIDFDPDLFAFIVEEVERFWTDCIIGGQEPALVNVADVLFKYPRHTAGKTAEASEELYADYLTLKDIRAEIKRLSDVKDEIESKIKMAMGDAETLSYSQNNTHIATWKAGKDKSEFDMGKFLLENPELYNKYTKTTTGTRRFTLK